MGDAVGEGDGLGGGGVKASAVGATTAKASTGGSGLAEEATVVHDTTTPSDTARRAYEKLALARTGGDHGITSAPYTAPMRPWFGCDAGQVVFTTQIALASSVGQGLPPGLHSRPTRPKGSP